jgi:hypothetical protein
MQLLVYEHFQQAQLGGGGEYSACIWFTNYRCGDITTHLTVSVILLRRQELGNARSEVAAVGSIQVTFRLQQTSNAEVTAAR